jgi:hypothetical protein
MRLGVSYQILQNIWPFRFECVLMAIVMSTWEGLATHGAGCAGKALQFAVG